MSIATNSRFSCANAGSPKLDLKGCVFYAPLWSPNTGGNTFMSSGAYGIPSHLCTVFGSPVWSSQGRTFDGATTSIVPLFNSVLRPSIALTIACWVSIASLAASTGTRDIYVARTGGSSFQFIVLGSGYGAGAGKAYFSKWISGVETSYTAATALTLNQKTFLALTYDSGTNVAQHYRNGIADGAAGTAAGAIDTNATGIKIGATSGFWDGLISEVEIYNRALTAPEILQIFNSTRRRYV